MTSLGAYVSTKMMEEAYYVDHYAKPVLKRWSVRGEEINYVQVSAAALWSDVVLAVVAGDKLRAGLPQPPPDALRPLEVRRGL